MNVECRRKSAYLCLNVHELLLAHLVCLLLLQVREVFPECAPGRVIPGSMDSRSCEMIPLALESLYWLMYFLIIFIVNVIFSWLGCAIHNLYTFIFFVNIGSQVVALYRIWLGIKGSVLTLRNLVI
jgi:hypothetical protein